jgi:hypothetical protein
VANVHVLVATTATDLAGELLSAAVIRSKGMVLVGSRVAAASELKGLLGGLSPSTACALVLVGPRSETRRLATRWLIVRRRLVVVQIDTAADIVQIAARDVGMEPLFKALRGLLDGDGPWAGLLGGSDDPEAHPLRIACSYRPRRRGLGMDFPRRRPGAACWQDTHG